MNLAVSVWRAQCVRRNLLLEKRVLILRILKSILFERLVTDHGVIGTEASQVNLSYIKRH